MLTSHNSENLAYRVAGNIEKSYLDYDNLCPNDLYIDKMNEIIDSE